MTIETATRSNTIEVNTDLLDEFAKIFSDDSKIPFLKVGILGDAATRSADSEDSDGITNAEIGAMHEFGYGVPIRSFLRMPLILKMSGALEKAGAFDKTALDAIKQKGLVPFMMKVGVVAEGVISDAFNTGGFGEWKPSNMANKKNHQTLVETQQLRNSIISEVVEV